MILQSLEATVVNRTGATNCSWFQGSKLEVFLKEIGVRAFRLCATGELRLPEVGEMTSSCQ